MGVTVLSRDSVLKITPSRAQGPLIPPCLDCLDFDSMYLNLTHASITATNALSPKLQSCIRLRKTKIQITMKPWPGSEYESDYNMYMNI